jgi:hypothetical protein
MKMLRMMGFHFENCGNGEELRRLKMRHVVALISGRATRRQSQLLYGAPKRTDRQVGFLIKRRKHAESFYTL